MLRWMTALVMVCGLAGCATSFTGEAHVDGGPAGCQKKCDAWGMDFAGMVAMGEYSDACVCHVRGKQASTSDDEADVAAMTGGAAGVVMQMQRAQQQQQAMHMH